MRLSLDLGIAEEIEIRLIKPSTRPVRTECGSLGGLKASISEKGLLQPIVVRPTDSGFEVVAGNRRFKACKALGLRKILSRVMDLDDKEAYEVALMENLQRQSLNFVEEATAFSRYVEEYGYGGETELAHKLGKSEQYISQRIRFLTLPRDLQEKVTRRLVSPTQAIELIGLEEPEQRAVSEMVVRDGISSRSVRRIARDLRRSHGESVGLDFETGRTKSDDRLERALGKCITTLRTSLIRLDDSTSSLRETDWATRDVLLSFSNVLRQEIDTLTRIRAKLRKEKYRRAL